jgi:uncharacterized protein (DUF2141 family)
MPFRLGASAPAVLRQDKALQTESLKSWLSVMLPFAALAAAGLIPTTTIASSGGATAATLDPAPAPEHKLQSCIDNNDGKSLILVKIEELQSTEGNIRVQIYSDNPDDFLEKGKKLLRIDVPIKHNAMKVCVPLPGPGNYAMVVMHDRNANGKADFLTEGFGFSNNPKLLLAPPDLDETLFAARAGVVEMTVSLIYLINVEQKEHRKRRRR